MMVKTADRGIMYGLYRTLMKGLLGLFIGGSDRSSSYPADLGLGAPIRQQFAFASRVPGSQALLHCSLELWARLRRADLPWLTPAEKVWKTAVISKTYQYLSPLCQPTPEDTILDNHTNRNIGAIYRIFFQSQHGIRTINPVKCRS